MNKVTGIIDAPQAGHDFINHVRIAEYTDGFWRMESGEIYNNEFMCVATDDGSILIPDIYALVLTEEIRRTNSIIQTLTGEPLVGTFYDDYAHVLMMVNNNGGAEMVEGGVTIAEGLVKKGLLKRGMNSRPYMITLNGYRELIGYMLWEAGEWAEEYTRNGTPVELTKPGYDELEEEVLYLKEQNKLLQAELESRLKRAAENNNGQ